MKTSSRKVRHRGLDLRTFLDNFSTDKLRSSKRNATGLEDSSGNNRTLSVVNGSFVTQQGLEPKWGRGLLCDRQNSVAFTGLAGQFLGDMAAVVRFEYDSSATGLNGFTHLYTQGQSANGGIDAYNAFEFSIFAHQVGGSNVIGYAHSQGGGLPTVIESFESTAQLTNGEHVVTLWRDDTAKRVVMKLDGVVVIDEVYAGPIDAQGRNDPLYIGGYQTLDDGTIDYIWSGLAYSARAWGNLVDPLTLDQVASNDGDDITVGGELVHHTFEDRVDIPGEVVLYDLVTNAGGQFSVPVASLGVTSVLYAHALVSNGTGTIMAYISEAGPTNVAGHVRDNSGASVGAGVAVTVLVLGSNPT